MLDLNTYDIGKLTERVAELKPSQALITNDGLIIRRRPNTAGFDCGVGQSGYGLKRILSAGEAAEWTLKESAKHRHPAALGGKERFEDVEAAIASVRAGTAKKTGPSPAIAELRSVAAKTELSSYRARAQKARDFLRKGDISRAVRQLEAIVEHAANHGNLQDIERARRALGSIKENHDYSADVPELFHNEVKVVTIGAGHHVFKNGKDMSGPMSRTEAEKRMAFLAREAARQEDVQEINDEVAGKPIVVSTETAA